MSEPLTPSDFGKVGEELPTSRDELKGSYS